MVLRKGYSTGSYVNHQSIMTSYKKGDSISEKMLPSTEHVNRPFDTRARRTGGGGGLSSLGGLLRGRIVQVERERFPMKQGGQTMQRSLNFLYNPEQIELSYSFDPNSFPAESQQTEYTVPVLGATGQTVGFTLYFNRMYEVATDRTQENMGVLADIQAIEYLMGSRDGQTVSMTEVCVVFGSTPKLKPFAYYGYLATVNVLYTHFSKRMIPMVAEVQVSMVRRFVSGDVSTESLSPTGVASGTAPGVDTAGHSLPGRSGDDNRQPSKPKPRTSAPSGGVRGRQGL